MTTKLFASAASLLIASSLPAFAAVILPAGSSWYTSTDGVNWSATTSQAPFGTETSGDFAYNTYWPAGTTIWLKTTINLSGYNLSTIQYDLGVDNGFDLYLNGTAAGNHVAGANAEGYTYRWEYSGPIGAGYLTTGNNDVILQLEDHGGLTAFDMQITGDLCAVPEPTTVFAGMSALGMLGLAVRRNRK